MLSIFDFSGRKLIKRYRRKADRKEGIIEGIRLGKPEGKAELLVDLIKNGYITDSTAQEYILKCNEN